MKPARAILLSLAQKKPKRQRKTTNGILTSNCSESEFIIKNGSSIEILGSKIYNDNGDYCIIIFGKIVQ